MLALQKKKLEQLAEQQQLFEALLASQTTGTETPPTTTAPVTSEAAPPEDDADLRGAQGGDLREAQLQGTLRATDDELATLLAAGLEPREGVPGLFLCREDGFPIMPTDLEGTKVGGHY